jgi:hypothetical protein
VALLFIALMIVLLAAPVVGEAVGAVISRGVERAAPGTFFLGLGILLTGLAFGFRILDIAGACLIGSVVLAFIMKHYLPSITGPAGSPWKPNLLLVTAGAPEHV